MQRQSLTDTFAFPTMEKKNDVPDLPAVLEDTQLLNPSAQVWDWPGALNPDFDCIDNHYGNLADFSQPNEPEREGAEFYGLFQEQIAALDHIKPFYFECPSILTARRIPPEEIWQLPSILYSEPQKSQWTTLEELRRTSNALYLKFFKLTAHHTSKGVKRLRLMYRNSKRLLDAGITTFRDVLDGHKPQSLKEVFAFTCLSYVMSTLLQKHGKSDNSRILSDANRWRWAIRKEADRLVYDQVFGMLWPEMNYAPDYASAWPESPKTRDVNSIWRRATPELSDKTHLPQDYGLHDHLLVLLQQTSTSEDFRFGDFLNIRKPELDKALGSQIYPPPTTQLMPPPERLADLFNYEDPFGELDPTHLGYNSYPTARFEILAQTEPLQLADEEIYEPLPSLESLIQTIMFQVVLEFMNFVTSLGDLLFHLSGCGITSRRKKHEGEHSHRPIQDFSEFVTGATNNILEPVKQDLGKQDETINAILSIAEAFVRHGNLQTVREIEEYIIVTARELVVDPFVRFLGWESYELLDGWIEDEGWIHGKCLCRSRMILE